MDTAGISLLVLGVEGQRNYTLAVKMPAGELYWLV
jgi:hypothetical protein